MFVQGTWYVHKSATYNTFGAQTPKERGNCTSRLQEGRRVAML